MKNFIVALSVFLLAAGGLRARQLAIVHTNDTHSQIDPADNGTGGTARLKAVIDSVRAARQHVVVVDAGDAVQGTMYFTIYKGEVEYRMLDELGYDLAVLGNHDFDNGVAQLARNLRNSKVKWLSANYTFDPSTGLADIFHPTAIIDFDGRKVGFMGINLDPKGMVAEGNYDGVGYLDATATARSVADDLRRDGADYVVAITHLGYDGTAGPSDSSIAAGTTGIDLIIGAHSHSTIQPANDVEGRYHWKHVNAAGDTVAVVQTGSKGANVGVTTIDLDNGKIDYELIPVDARLDCRTDSAVEAIVDGYRSRVDSVMNIKAAVAADELTKADRGLMNFLGDFLAREGERLAGAPVDMALLNAGGVRRDLPRGQISKGMLIDMLPFNNRIVVLEISGADLLEAVDNVVARGAADGINASTRIVFDPDTRKGVQTTIGGTAVDPDRTYTIATIDYLAGGGDYMTPLTRARLTHRSPNVLYDDLIEYIETEWRHTPIVPDNTPRLLPIKQ